MDRRNYYEIIDKLSFDPLEMKDKKIIDAIELWKLLEEKRGISNEETNGEQRQRELDMYDDIIACLTNKDARKKEAEAMKQKQKKKLDDIIAVLKEGSDKSGLYISNSRLLSIARSLRLDKEKTVKKAFVDAGFEVIVRKPVNVASDITLPNTIFKGVIDNIKKLNTMSSKDYAWLNSVTNLYDLAAYFKNDADNKDLYPSKSAAELKGVMEAGAAQVAGKLDALNHCLADLFQAGSTQVFKDEKTKMKYDNSLKVEQLYPLFSLLKEMPDEMKNDSYIAEICIKKIQLYFNDPEIALAIYNKEAGNVLDPYEPDSGDIDYICGSCKSITKINYGTDREKCLCAACKSPLFVKCRQCSELIPANADICPECGFNLTESKFFDRYCTLTKIALETMDIAEAQKQLSLAKNARPNDPQLKTLENEVNHAEKIYGEPLKKINDLLVENKYIQARNELLEFCKKYPAINVKSIKEKIETVISQADLVFSNIESQTSPCDACFGILEKISDYTKAINYIKEHRPKSVVSVNAIVSSETNKVTVQWKGTGEQQVTYYVVRKENTPPKSVNDGKVLLSGEIVTQFVDDDLIPGVVYCYSVFAQRLGNYSEPCSATPCILFEELDKNSIISISEESKCILSWRLPKNCQGVRVLRSEGNNVSTSSDNTTKVVSACSLNGYEDNTVVNGKRYGYRLQCVYNTGSGVRYSAGRIISVLIEGKPVATSLVSVTVKSKYAVQVSWKPIPKQQNCVIDLYDIKSNVTISESTSYHITELAQLGEKIGTIADVSAGTSELRLNKQKGFNVCAFVIKGEYAAASNCIAFSNFDKVEMDKAKTKITNGNLVIVLQGNFNPYLSNLRYAVSTKNSENEKAPWCSIGDAPAMSQVALNTYVADGMIRIGKVPPKEIYISVIGEYRVDQSVYFSEPTKLRLSNRPKMEISYKMIWGLLNKKKNVKLVIECDSDCELPEMTLCFNKTIKVPINVNAPNTIVLCKTDEQLDYKAHSKLEIEIANTVWNNAPKGNEIRLFIPDDSYSEFRMLPDVNSLKIP